MGIENSSVKKIVFPDTNIFLHYQALDQIDLVTLLDCAEVELVIAPVVLDDLDHHKWEHPLSKLRERAHESTKRISTWVSREEPIRNGVSVQLQFARPRDITLAELQLNPRSSDDLLLATIWEYSISNSDRNVVLLTGDVGIRLRARSLSITAQVLPDEFRLPSARDELQRETQLLRSELATLQQQIPSPVLSFANGTDRLELVIEPQLSAVQSIAELVKKVENDLWQEAQRYLSPRDETYSLGWVPSTKLEEMRTSQRGWPFFEEPSEQEIERYRKEIDEYPKRYETYLVEKLEIENEHRRSIRLDLIIANTGHRLAEDMLLTLTLPNHLSWRDEPSSEELPELPSPPTPPLTPTQQLFKEKGYMPWSETFGSLAHRYAFDPGDILLDRNVSDSGQVLEWEIGDCRQQLSLPLESLYLMFNAGDRITNFYIDYTIHEKNLPKPIEGRLLVILQEEDSSLEEGRSKSSK